MSVFARQQCTHERQNQSEGYTPREDRELSLTDLFSSGGVSQRFKLGYL